MDYTVSSPDFGEEVSSTTQIRSKNFIPCFPNTAYYNGGTRAIIICYDASKKGISSKGIIYPDSVFSTPDNCYYLRFYCVPEYGTTYHNDICINISDASKNGTYEPYTTSALSLPISDKFLDGMDGVGTAYDEQTPTDYYKRMGIVDLGNLPWYTSSAGTDIFYATISNMKYHNEPSVIANIKTASYVSIPYNDRIATDKSICGLVSSYGASVMIHDSSLDNYTTAQVKTALSGKYLIFELSTPLQNYGVVDLGSLEWRYTSPTFVSEDIIDMKISTMSDVGLAICASYIPAGNVSASNMPNMSWRLSGNYTQAFIFKNTSYNDADLFKASLNGVYLFYEKANPQPITPALDMTFKAWKDGTEQILPENTSDPYTAPIRTDMTYMSTDEAVLYLKDHAVTDPTVIDDIEDLKDDVGDLQTDVGTLQTDVGTIQTQIGSESTTPMTGILGRLNTDESSISSMQSTVTDLDNYAGAFASGGSVTSGIRTSGATQSVTLQANESKLVTISKAPLSGYTYAGLYGFSSGDNEVLISTVEYSELSQSVMVRLKNTNSSQTTTSVSVILTFIKNYSGGN